MSQSEPSPELSRASAEEVSLADLAERAHDEDATTIVVNGQGEQLAAVVPIGRLAEVARARISAAVGAVAERDAAHGEIVEHPVLMQQHGVDERGRPVRAA